MCVRVCDLIDEGVVTVFNCVAEGGVEPSSLRFSCDTGWHLLAWVACFSRQGPGATGLPLFEPTAQMHKWVLGSGWRTFDKRIAS